MALNAEIFEEREQWKTPLAVSSVLHAALFLSLFVYAYVFGGPTQSWGNGGMGGDAMSANLVSSIPLPAKPDATNVLATENKGLTQSQPKPKVEEPEAIPIQDKKTKVKPAKKPVTPVEEKPREVAEVDNKIPYGEGGPVSGPYGVFSANGAKGGFSMSGGSGDFGSKYGWYVDAVRRKVSENWLKYEIDPNIAGARRVYITFDISRGGAPGNIQIEQSSGVPSLDLSAVRALQRIDTFGPLPGDYSGSKVNVEFWFDPKR
ncbi:MAG: energy transducer TonB [Acidobacteriaceae bacterium]